MLKIWCFVSFSFLVYGNKCEQLMGAEFPIFSLSESDRLVDAIQGSLTDNLLKPEWLVKKTQASPGTIGPYFGHCYHASEALYHLLGGKALGLKPMRLKMAEGSHWYIQTQRGAILDPTALQFLFPPDYTLGKGNGFLTKKPSQRAQIIIDKVLLKFSAP